MLYLSSTNLLTVSPNSRAVPSMNCQNPAASTPERASGLQLLSISIRYFISSGTPSSLRICSISGRYLLARFIIKVVLVCILQKLISSLSSLSRISYLLKSMVSSAKITFSGISTLVIKAGYNSELFSSSCEKESFTELLLQQLQDSEKIKREANNVIFLLILFIALKFSKLQSYNYLQK